MPSILLSDNGVSSGSAGLKTIAASDGSLALQTTTAGGAATTAVTIDTSQRAAFVAGTAAAPAITTSGDTNTGIFFPAADTIAFAEGGAEAMRLDSSGNMGLGVTPSAWNSNRKVLQINRASLVGTDGNETNLGSNYYWNGTSNLYIASTNATLYNQGAGAHIWYNSASGTAGNAISFTQAMTLDASGNLGVGTTSPLSKIDARAANATIGNYQTIQAFSTETSAAIDLGGGISLGGFFNSTQIAQYASIAGRKENGTSGNYAGYLQFGTNSQATGVREVARIDSSGNLLVGTTSSLQTTVGVRAYIDRGGISGYDSLAVTSSRTTNTESCYDLYSTGAFAYRFYVGLGGTVFATSTTITGISDIRLKENIRDLDDGLDVVMALKPRKFDWKAGKGADIKNARGFIAQEFEQVLPDMIEQWRDPAPEGEEPYKAVNANLIPTLVKAIQEQQALITTLTERITALEAKP